MGTLLRMWLLAGPCAWVGVRVSDLSGWAPLGLIVGVCVWVAAVAITSDRGAEA